MNIIFLHGFGEDETVWTDLLKLLDKSHNYICPDYSELDHCKTIADYAKWLKKGLEFNNINEAVIIGHSMGGYIALEFANLYPRNTIGLGLFNSTARNDNDDKRENRDKSIKFIENHGAADFIDHFYPKMFSEEFKNSNPELIQTNVEKFSNIPAEALIAATKAMKDRNDHFELLHQLNVPIFQIIGILDTFVPFQDALEQSHQIKNPNLLVLGNMAHAGMYENTEVCAHFINDYFKTFKS